MEIARDLAASGADGGAGAGAPPHPDDLAQALLAQNRGTGPLDVRGLAADLLRLQGRGGQAAFAPTLRAVEARLSPADQSRLAHDLGREAALPALNRGLGAASRPAADAAVRLTDRPQGTVTASEVKAVLADLHGARADPRTPPADRDPLLALYLQVFARGQSEGVIGPGMTPEVLQAGLGAMAFSGPGPSAGLRVGGAVEDVPAFTPTRGPFKMHGPPAGGEATVGHSTTKDYRATFRTANPHIGPVVVHHGVEQQTIKRNEKLFSVSEMHSVENLRGIPHDINGHVHLRSMRRDWNTFYMNNPNPTRKEILNFATRIDAKYGEFFLPPRN